MIIWLASYEIMFLLILTLFIVLTQSAYGTLFFVLILYFASISWCRIEHELTMLVSPLLLLSLLETCGEHWASLDPSSLIYISGPCFTFRYYPCILCWSCICMYIFWCDSVEMYLSIVVLYRWLPGSWRVICSHLYRYSISSALILWYLLVNSPWVIVYPHTCY